MMLSRQSIATFRFTLPLTLILLSGCGQSQGVATTAANDEAAIKAEQEKVFSLEQAHHADLQAEQNAARKRPK